MGFLISVSMSHITNTRNEEIQVSIFVITHKPYNKSPMKGYKTLQVGACKGHLQIGDVFDDTGENISEKNPQFCELTGLYWLSRNCNDNYIGTCHYRRFFSTDFFGKKPVNERKVLRILNKKDMIVPFSRKLDVTVAEQYCRNSGYNKDLLIVRDIIAEKYPDYLVAYDNVFNGKITYFYNMLIAKEEVYKGYCDWLFNILFEAEKRVDTTGYNDYQKRIFGFLSERLLSVWIHTNNIEVFEMGVINTEESPHIVRKLLSGLKRSLLSLGT